MTCNLTLDELSSSILELIQKKVDHEKQCDQISQQIEILTLKQNALRTQFFQNTVGKYFIKDFHFVHVISYKDGEAYGFRLLYTSYGIHIELETCLPEWTINPDNEVSKETFMEEMPKMILKEGKYYEMAKKFDCIKN